MRLCLDAPLQECSQLKSKLGALQIKINESDEKLKVVDQREKNALDSLSKERSKISLLYEELAQKKTEAEEARDEANLLKEAQNSSADEAMMRRLDNERKYLRNQLENEVQTRKSLEENLQRITCGHKNIQQCFKIELDGLKLQIQELRANKSESDARSLSVKEALEAEFKLKNEELVDVKKVYLKTRDELRIEQASAEQVRSASKRLAQELQAVHDEMEQTKLITEETKERHVNNIHAISLSIKQTENHHSEEIKDLQNELHHTLNNLGKSQRELLDMQTQIISEKIKVKKIDSVKNLGILLPYICRQSTVSCVVSFDFVKTKNLINCMDILGALVFVLAVIYFI